MTGPDVTGLRSLAEQLHLGPLARSAVWAVAVYGAFSSVVFLIERRQGRDLARYRTRNFANDVLYTLFYKASFYKVLVLAAVTNLVDSRFPGLKLGLLAGMSWPVGLAVFWIGGDFLTYWWHRWQHSNRFLWALHSVHHSQEQLTLLSASRRHPLENLSMDVLIYFVGFHLLLGVPTQGWAPLLVGVTSFAAIQHAQLDWRLGPFERVLAGPHFHAFHHSADATHANANFAFLFSFWDHLFGTAVDAPQRPTRYGVPDIDFGESLTRQLLLPFALMWRWRRGPVATPTPASPELGPAGVPARAPSRLELP